MVVSRARLRAFIIWSRDTTHGWRRRPNAGVGRRIGRYVIHDEIAAAGGWRRCTSAGCGPGRLLAHGRHQAASPAVREGSRVRRDVPRRGAPRRAHPPPERRADARRRRDATASSSSSWSTCRASRSRASCARRTSGGERIPPRDRRRRSSRGVLHGLHAAHEARTSAASRSASCTATCRRRTSSSASTASRACSTSASRRRAGRVQTTREGQLKGKLAYMAPEQLARATLDRARPTSTPRPSSCGRRSRASGSCRERTPARW